VLASAGEPNLDVSDLSGRIDDTLAWITWGGVREAVENAASDLAVADASIASSIQRVAQSLVAAIVRHS